MKSLIPFDESIPMRESLLKRHGNSRNWMPSILMLFITIVAILLFFVKFELSILVTGHVRPATLPYSLRSEVTGLISRIYVKENQRVKKGQLLLSVDSEELEIKLKDLEDQINFIHRQLNDLESLLFYPQDSKIPRPLTPVFRAEFRTYIDRIRVLNQRIRYQKSILDRNRPLQEKEMISEMEMEVKIQAYEEALLSLSEYKTQKVLEWQQLTESRSKYLTEVRIQRKLLMEEINAHTLVSPCNGFIQNISVGSGTLLTKGDRIMEAIPDTTLIVELWLSPQKILFLDRKQPIEFEVHAFNSFDWGRVQGEVISIADDITQLNNNFFYRVICSISAENSGEIRIKKGMDLTARLYLNELNFYQYIFKDFREWLKESNHKIPINV